ncbi:MAG: beta-propeller domain-containing protein, partial [Chthoniobacteraceae bacterium]
MKAHLRHLAFCLIVLIGSMLPMAAHGAGPTLGPVRGKVVFVNVPPGFKSVTLQQRTGIKAKPWKMLGKRQADPAGGMIGFMLKSAVSPRALIATGERVTPETSDSGAGARLFLADPALVTSSGMTGTGGVMSGAVALSAAKADAVTVSGSASPSVSREVVESDIWRVDGKRLYFFNQLRGLQVFDISDPDDPTMLGQLREPNRGEQMYLLDPEHVALLTRPSYYFSIALAPVRLVGKSASTSYTPGSGAIVIAGVKRGKPVELARVSYPGYFVESRLVGSALYVVSQVYDNNQSGLQVTSFDLSDPVHPKQADTLSLGSYGSTIAATDRFLFVVGYGNDWRRSKIDVIDISAPDGTLVRRGKIETAGQ